MAGAGYKLFNTGDVLTAAQVNTYLQQQTVMVFADASARTTALASVLAEGMMSYLQDTNSVEVYNGSAWVGVSSDQIPLTTKGDLLTYSTTDTRLGVGTDGQVLTADSAEATGLKWANNTSVQPFLGYKVSTNFYGIATITGPTSRSGVAANITYYYAIYFDGQTTFDRIGMRTAGAFSGTGVFRLGIYNASLTTGKPTTVYLDAGTVSATAPGVDYMVTINITPPAGYYFIAGNCQTAAATNTITGITTSSPNLVNPFGKNNSTNFGYTYFAESVNVTGGFATAGTLTDERTVDVLGFLRIA